MTQELLGEHHIRNGYLVNVSWKPKSQVYDVEHILYISGTPEEVRVGTNSYGTSGQVREVIENLRGHQVES